MNPELERKERLSKYEGWRDFAEGEPDPEPDLLTKKQIRALSDAARFEYNRARGSYHGNILVRTREVDIAMEHLADQVESAMQGPDRVKGASAIDAAPSVGKSTILTRFGREFHRSQIARYGRYLDDGDTLHIPVCHIGFTGKMTTKGLNGKIFDFYNHPSVHDRKRRPATDDGLAAEAADAAVRHGTRLFVVDDVHFLKPLTKDGGEVANQLKWIANEYPVTFVYAGVNLNDKGILEEGSILETAQTARRWTLIPLNPFTIFDPVREREWEQLIRSIERRVVLAEAYQGMLLSISDYLFARSTGYIGSLMTLITRGITRAIRTGAERLDQELLDRVLTDTAAERRRVETAAAVQVFRETGRIPPWAVSA